MTGVQTCALPISVILQTGQAVIMNNKNVIHARKGTVGDRLLLRVWIEKQ